MPTAALVLLPVLLLLAVMAVPCPAAPPGTAAPLPLRGARASTSREGFPPSGALPAGDRFAATAGHCWQGAPGAPGWWWQADLGVERAIGGILQVVGDDEFRLRHAPHSYRWLASRDGRRWRPLREAAVKEERRAYRLHRLRAAVSARYLRLEIFAAVGEYPTLRSVEFYAEPGARPAFPEWAVVVSATTRWEPLGAGAEFLPLARDAGGGAGFQAQNVWLGELDEGFLRVEPHPLAVFVSGSFRDWCEVERAPWQGLLAVARGGRWPLWASCGGAQGLAIAEEHGLEGPWDCPHCRDPRRPRIPIYGHIGHTGATLPPCGDYSSCIFERGPTLLRRVALDPVLAGLPEEFALVESHCGQLEWVPRGWRLLVVGGEGARTRVQCLRRGDAPVYAAQFHIELAGTPEASRAVMRGFLNLARGWRGGSRVPP